MGQEENPRARPAERAFRTPEKSAQKQAFSTISFGFGASLDLALEGLRSFANRHTTACDPAESSSHLI
jgi:hypothetical protein